MSDKLTLPVQDVNTDLPNPQDAFRFIGYFETVTVAPTKAPRNFMGQIKIYTSGGVYRLYWYDSKNNAWHYVTA